ncbi:uncharacterized protein METZ01_LOCUS252968, partial [marine metagenome]
VTDLAGMRILLSNDDGIDAPGLKCLERVARKLSEDVWIVAPERDQSGVSHALSLSDPVRYRSLGDRKFAVEGTPTDSVLLGILNLIPPPRPNLLLSGVNRGGNLGDDVTYSGTVAAAMEGTLLGIPSIALSQYTVQRENAKWATAENYAPDLIRRLVTIGWSSDVLMNVNFPDVSEDKVGGVSVAYQGRGKPGSVLERRGDVRGRDYYWIGSTRTNESVSDGSDLSEILAGRITVTPLHMNLTDQEAYESLSKALK